MSILFAGGAGFLGTNFVNRLISDGYDVVVLDNFSTGKISNVNHKAKLIQADVTNTSYLNSLGSSWSHVINFACPASPPAYQSNPVHTMMTNVLGTKNLLDIAVRSAAMFIHASTSEIYGDPLVHPQVENYRGNVNTLGPRACYDEGKRAAETLIADYRRLYGISIRVARIFNTYGPFMDPDDGRVVSNFICQVLQNKNITIYGNGQQTRSFTYVDDLIEGFYRMLLSSKDRDFLEPINLGNENEFTISELADLVMNILPNSTSQIVNHSLPEDDPRQRKPDITKARQILGWEPQVNLEIGLPQTVEYFRNQLGLSKPVI